MALNCTMILGDCFEVLPALLKASVQMVFADLPYGVTLHNYDHLIDLSCFWPSIYRVTQMNAAICCSATQPFTTDLILSNRNHFKYDLTWKRGNVTGFFNAKKQPLRATESILLFYRRQCVYNPIKTTGHVPYRRVYAAESYQSVSAMYGRKPQTTPSSINDGTRYPTSLLDLGKTPELRTGYGHSTTRIHPSQKPIALLDWLIRTYSDPRDTVLDPVSGSGTTACSSLLSGRNVVCIERDEGYHGTAVERVRKVAKDNAIDVQIEVRT